MNYEDAFTLNKLYIENDTSSEVPTKILNID